MELFKSNYSLSHLGKKTIEPFEHYGIIAYCGKQGSGKSISACKLINELQINYNVLVMSNIPINTDYIEFRGLESLIEFDVKNSGYDGLVCFIDEITLYFNSLDSKVIDRNWFNIINMLRKRHILIIGTCPVFNRIAKPFREQFEYFVDCNRKGRLQSNDVYKSVSVSLFSEDSCNFEFIKNEKFFHKQWMYDFYDTFEIIKGGVKK